MNLISHFLYLFVPKYQQQRHLAKFSLLSSASLNYNSLTLQRPHIQPLQIQSSMSQFHRYPIAENFGLDAFNHQQQVHLQQQQLQQ